MVDNLYWQPPTDAQLNAWRGTKTLADFPEPVETVWRENYRQAIWFRSMLSQFHYSAIAGAGLIATGFNYDVAYRDFDDMGLTGVELDEWKWKLKVMESAALKNINEATK